MPQKIQMLIRGYYEQLSGKKVNNLKEMNKFSEVYNLLRLNQKETENLNRTITNKTESVITSFPTQESPGTDGFTD